MKCLYCGEPLALALLKRFTGGGEFCSDACKTNYQVEFTQLAVGRLQQARQVRRPGASFALPNGIPETAVAEPAPPLPGPVAEPEFVAAARQPEPEAIRRAPVEPPPPPLQGLAHPPEPLFFRTADWEAQGVAVAMAGPITALLDEPLLAPSSVAPEPFVYTPPPPPEPEPDLPAGGFVGYALRALSQVFDRIPVIQPAAVMVYLQFPIDPRQSRLARPFLAAAGTLETGVAPRMPGRDLYGRVSSILDGFYQALDGRPRMVARRVRLAKGLGGPAGLMWLDPTEPALLAVPGAVFAPRGLGFTSVQAGLEFSDPRYDQFLRPASRETLLERIRHMRRQPLAEVPSATAAPAPEHAGETAALLEQVKPALDLLKSLGDTLAAQPGSLAIVPGGASLSSAPVEPLAPAGVAPVPPPGWPTQPSGPGDGAALVPWSGVSRPLAGVATPPLPAPRIDPALMRPQSAGTGGPALPAGLVGPNSQAFLFGSELSLADSAGGGEAEPPDAEPLNGNLPVPQSSAPGAGELQGERLPTPAPPPASGPNFNQVTGFGPPAGGSMNIGTMVVVNQPAGAVTINAAPSSTAATFEARLKPKKEPGPLSSIAEAVGLQIPARTAPEALPLRMNFAGCLTTSTPIHWPALSTAVMRRKFFFGAPPKQILKRPEPVLAAPSVRSAAPAPEPPPLPVPAGGDKGGWLKALSGRFGRK